MVRLQVTLDSTEAEALARWAASELRDPRDQIRFVLRQELERRGLLPADGRPTEVEPIIHGESNERRSTRPACPGHLYRRAPESGGHGQQGGQLAGGEKDESLKKAKTRQEQGGRGL